MTRKSELSIRFCFFPLLFVLFPLQMTSGAEDDLPDMDDVVWMTQSESAAESMPVGSGDVGVNVWVFFVTRLLRR